MDYSDVINSAYDHAEEIGKNQTDTAWLDLDGVWWPNPHYKGESVCHPECDPETTDGRQWNPPFGPTLRERLMRK